MDFFPLYNTVHRSACICFQQHKSCYKEYNFYDIIGPDKDILFA